MAFAQDIKRIRTTISFSGKLLIRTMDEMDIPTVVELSKKMHAMGPYSRLPFDENKVAEIGAWMSHPKSAYWGAIAEYKGEAIGMVIAYYSEVLCCRALQTFDVVLYVDEDKKGTFAGLKLIHAYIGWAKSIGAVDCNILASGMYNNENTYKLLQKLGFTPAGGLFKMVLGE